MSHPSFFSFRKPPNSARWFHQSGQVGVVILLMMAVILTVGLSVVSRTTQDVNLANQTSDSARVFNATESVLDQAVNQLLQSFGGSPLVTTGTVTVNDTEVTYNIAESSTMENRIYQGESVMINLVDRSLSPEVGLPVGGSRNLRVDWSKTDFDAECTVSPLQPASLLVFVYSVSGAQTNLRTQTIAGCNRSDGFTASSNGSAPYRFSTNIALQAGDLFVRLKPVYANTHMMVSGSGVALPSEQYTITADARNLTGNETRKIRIDQTLPTAPSVMDYVLYSGGTIVK